MLEVKGNFCQQVRGILEDAGRADDYVELGIGGRWRWNPLGDDLLDSYSLAYTIASLINQLFGRSKEPFWQQVYVHLVRWIIELHRMAPARWVTLRDVYRCTLDPERIEAKIAEVEALVEPPATVRVRMAKWRRTATSWRPGRGGRKVAACCGCRTTRRSASSWRSSGSPVRDGPAGAGGPGAPGTARRRSSAGTRRSG